MSVRLQTLDDRSRGHTEFRAHRDYRIDLGEVAGYAFLPRGDDGRPRLDLFLRCGLLVPTIFGRDADAVNARLQYYFRPETWIEAREVPAPRGNGTPVDGQPAHKTGTGFGTGRASSESSRGQ